MHRYIMPAALAFASCGGHPFGGGCTLSTTSASIAGPGATDCGEIAAGADGTAPWACAVQAFDAGTPFFLQIDAVGIDSVVLFAVVSDGDRVWHLEQDQYDGVHARIDAQDCVDPVDGTQPDDSRQTDDVSGYPIVICGDLTPHGNHMEACGTCSGCTPPGLPFDQ